MVAPSLYHSFVELGISPKPNTMLLYLGFVMKVTVILIHIGIVVTSQNIGWTKLATYCFDSSNWIETFGVSLG
jgi:hypothetical protein